MAQNRNLRSADQLISPAIDAMVAALDPPDADGPLVALVRRQARVIDGMPDAVASAMLPNHGGPLLRALAELERRAAARRKPEQGPKTRLAQLREARAAGPGRR
jgi:hypothetical protein